jgi:hypothetical protein
MNTPNPDALWQPKIGRYMCSGDLPHSTATPMLERSNTMKRFTTTDAKAIRKLLVPKGAKVRIDVGYRENKRGDWDADINNWKRLPNGEHVDLGDIDDIKQAHKMSIEVVQGTRFDLYIYDAYQCGGYSDWEMRGNTEVIWNGSEWVTGSYIA